jgi:hypothetical protein
MDVLRSLLRFILAIMQDLVYGWIPALTELVRALCLRVHASLNRLRLPGRLSKTANTQCVKISDPAFKRPDPTIYDQYYLTSQGIAVTWDNPDIQIEEGGVPVSPHSLKPNTDRQSRPSHTPKASGFSRILCCRPGRGNCTGA